MNRGAREGDRDVGLRGLRLSGSDRPKALVLLLIVIALIPSLGMGVASSFPCGTIALAARNRLGGLHRAAFWRALGFPNLVLARAAKTKKRRQRKLEEWKREELRRTPYALLDDPPPELRAPAKPWQRR